jgi:hypothetical protein
VSVVSSSCQCQLSVVSGDVSVFLFFDENTRCSRDNPDQIGSRLLRKYNFTVPFPWQLATDTGNCSWQLLYLNG